LEKNRARSKPQMGQIVLFIIKTCDNMSEELYMTSGPYVLLVEDDLDISESIQTILVEENYHVQCKYNGREALEYLTNTEVEPSLILLDVMMPFMNGYQFREAQLKNPRIANIPTIILSAANELQDDEQFHFNDFIQKPLDIETLLQAIKKNILH